MIAVASHNSLSSDLLTLEIEGVAGGMDARSGTVVLGRNADLSNRGAVARFLAPTREVEGGRIDVPRSQVLPVPSDVSRDAALCAPFVAEAIRGWDMLALEIGATALVTRQSGWSRLFEIVAGWYGAFPLGLETPASPDAGEQSDNDAVAQLRTTLQQAPRVCVAELSGRPDLVDLVLESIPRYTHVLFAGEERQRLTIDYYVNVHRKGLQLHSTVLSPGSIFDADLPGHSSRVARVWRLLQRPDRAEACLTALAALSAGPSSHR